MIMRPRFPRVAAYGDLGLCFQLLRSKAIEASAVLELLNFEISLAGRSHHRHQLGGDLTIIVDEEPATVQRIMRGQ